MATVYGVNATKRDNQFVKDLVPQGEYGGNVRVAYDYYTAPGAVIATGDIKLMKLPAGARVVGVMAKWEDHGTTGAMTLGWEANGTETVDADGLIAAIDLTSAGTSVTLASAGMFQKFSAETQISLTVGTATDASTSKSIWVAVSYVVE